MLMLYRVTSVTDASCYCEATSFQEAIDLAEAWFMEIYLLKPGCVMKVEVAWGDPVLRKPAAP